MKFFTRKSVQPHHLNPNGTLFGGACMAWVDEEAAIFASIEAGTNRVVTKYISEINFIAPAYLGDIVEIGVALKKVGRTSLTLQVDVRILHTKQVIVSIDEIVFVTLGEDGKPTRHALSTK